MNLVIHPLSSSIRVPLQEATGQAVVDSLHGFVPDSPLPGGAAAAFRFLFNVPQWLQIGGAIVGVLVAAWVTVRLWKARHLIIEWFSTRAAGTRVTIIAAGSLVALIAIAGAGKTWHFMQYDNDFCISCHVMQPASSRFSESEHTDLGCHDCHNQSIIASTKQLVMWVAERPVEIGDHTPLANAVCENCHVTGQDSVAWQQMHLTAGHRVHFESDSSVLADLLCVTCHGAEVHRFVPANQTCGQSGCHESVEIQLAAMADQTSLHCAACHQFTAMVPALATTDSARGTMIASLEQCESCHEMQVRLEGFDPAREPHGATCGTCHNPHTQIAVAEATTTCVECHDDWEVRPFHVGPNHTNVGESCTLCHEPHAARVDPSDCTGCHRAVLDRDDVPPATRRRLERAMPFDTTAALRQSGAARAREEDKPAAIVRRRSVSPSSPSWLGAGFALQEEWLRPVDAAAHGFARAADPPQSVSDTFSHAQHESLTCLNCHTTESGHGSLTFEAPRGCQICHHQQPASSDCSTCHSSTEFSAPIKLAMTLAVRDGTPRTRQVDLVHDEHATLACIDCHSEPVTLAAAPTAAACTDCHADHHGPAHECADCHGGAAMLAASKEAHAPPVDAHVACDACHARSTMALLAPDESFCRACHSDLEPEHQAASERACTACHMLLEPDEFREKLVTREGGR